MASMQDSSVSSDRGKNPAEPAVVPPLTSTPSGLQGAPSSMAGTLLSAVGPSLATTATPPVPATSPQESLHKPSQAMGPKAVAGMHSSMIVEPVAIPAPGSRPRATPAPNDAPTAADSAAAVRAALTTAEGASNAEDSGLASTPLIPLASSQGPHPQGWGRQPPQKRPRVMIVTSWAPNETGIDTVMSVVPPATAAGAGLPMDSTSTTAVAALPSAVGAGTAVKVSDPANGGNRVNMGGDGHHKSMPGQGGGILPPYPAPSPSMPR
ncbi:unnamed protein product [Discosporangium mesarthrocarpum]